MLCQLNLISVIICQLSLVWIIVTSSDVIPTQNLFEFIKTLSFVIDMALCSQESKIYPGYQLWNKEKYPGFSQIILPENEKKISLN